MAVIVAKSNDVTEKVFLTGPCIHGILVAGFLQSFKIFSSKTNKIASY